MTFLVQLVKREARFCSQLEQVIQLTLKPATNLILVIACFVCAMTVCVCVCVFCFVMFCFISVMRLCVYDCMCEHHNVCTKLE